MEKRRVDLLGRLWGDDVVVVVPHVQCHVVTFELGIVG